MRQRSPELPPLKQPLASHYLHECTDPPSSTLYLDGQQRPAYNIYSPNTISPSKINKLKIYFEIFLDQFDILLHDQLILTASQIVAFV